MQVVRTKKEFLKLLNPSQINIIQWFEDALSNNWRYSKKNKWWLFNLPQTECYFFKAPVLVPSPTPDSHSPCCGPWGIAHVPRNLDSHDLRQGCQGHHRFLKGKWQTIGC